MMFLLFCTLMALSEATHIYQSPYNLGTGISQQYRDQDASGNYRFGYDESHSSGGTFRDETGDAWGNKYGSYGLREADGRYRVVNYVADSQGFRADVKSNEPGVAPKDPASTTIQKSTWYTKSKNPEPITVQKPILYAAPEVPEPVAVQKPILYASPVIHHSYNPEFPLLYQAPYYPSYSNYRGYGNYKGTPFRRYGTGTYFTKKGAPIVSTKGGYYIYP